ncbi:Cof-type HAD-IIB family hydrolase [Canibacter sp. lx-45]|uniref:HAD family hydrolase n=1 Tax=Canibacter zhuwentaonis TaxID=2837491 RepID=UPI001BDBC0FA|nr:Cof-type HAD-IIB family hydrolase [Canibacter zhuwentaonis]
MTAVRAACALMIALDLDGTVLHEDETIDADLAQTLRKIDALPHVEIVLATGRAFDATLPVVEKLGLSLQWLVCCNGAVTLRRSEPSGVFEKHRVCTFDPSPMLRRLRETLPEANIAVEGGDGVFYYMREIPFKTLPNRRELVDYERLLTIEGTRVVAVSHGYTPQEFLDIADEMRLNHTVYAVGEAVWLDATRADVDKSTALELVRRALRVQAAGVFAAGDGNNDLQMIEWAAAHGTAVAMGQASERIKNAATRVTGSVAEGGLMRALREWEPLKRVL